MKCLVRGCNQTVYPKTDKNVAIKMFTFPKNEIIRRKWYRACGIAYNYNRSTSSSYVCAIHFDESAYTLKSRLGFGANRGVRHLKPDAIPSLKLPEVFDDASLLATSNLVVDVNSSVLLDHDYRACITDDLKTKVIEKYKDENKKLIKQNKILQNINTVLKSKTQILEDEMDNFVQDHNSIGSSVSNRIKSLQEQSKNNPLDR